MYTEIQFVYRDASNYKNGASVFFEGAITQEQRTAIQNTLDQQMYFIPHDVGLKELQSGLPNYPSEDDHVWHEMEGALVVESLPPDAEVKGNIRELADAFASIGSPSGWKIEEAMRRLNLYF